MSEDKDAVSWKQMKEIIKALVKEGDINSRFREKAKDIQEKIEGVTE
jgi:hypothetical protein